MNATWCPAVIRLLVGTHRCGTPLDEQGRCVNAVHHVADESGSEAAQRLYVEMMVGRAPDREER